MRSVLNEDTSFMQSVAKAMIDAGNKYDVKRKNDPAYLKGSISRYAKNLVMTFPMLCDDTLSIETAQMLSKANERNIANMMQLMFSSMAISGNNGAEVLSRFHKNIEDMSLDDVIDTIDSVVGESYKETAIERAVQRDILKEMTSELKKPQKLFPVESLNEKSLLNYQVRNMNGKMRVLDRKVAFNEAVPVDPNIAAAKEKREEDKNAREWNKDAREDTTLQMNYDKEQRDKKKSSLQQANDAAAQMSKQILDNDIKKSNELQPTLLVVNVYAKDQDNNYTGDKTTFMAGIKSRLIAVSAMDIVERLVSKNRTKLSFKNFLRATTGEINFITDFLFCFKQAKINAKNAVKKGEAAKMWNTLEKRSTKNNMRKMKKSGNDASAITTLVINMETVNYLKNAFNMDMNSVKEASAMMDEYNLLCLVIADEANEVAKFLYDGNNSFDMVAYSSLAREASDKSYKKVINLINQAGR